MYHLLKYNYHGLGPFEVFPESKRDEKNIGNYYILCFLKTIYDANIQS